MNWSLFTTVYGLVFIAELPDKTSFASLLLSSRLGPRPVFVGACAAFAVQSAVAVAAGSLVGFLPERIVHLSAGILFLAMAALLWLKEPEEDESSETRREGGDFWKAAGSAFAVVFVAEWGDLTQIATAALAAKYRAPWTIFSSATLALWTAAGLAVAAGRWAKNRVSAAVLQKAAAIAFLGAGLFFLFRIA